MILTKHWWWRCNGHQNQNIALSIIYRKWKNIGWRIEICIWRSAWTLEYHHNVNIRELILNNKYVKT